MSGSALRILILPIYIYIYIPYEKWGVGATKGVLRNHLIVNHIEHCFIMLSQQSMGICMGLKYVLSFSSQIVIYVTCVSIPKDRGFGWSPILA